MKNDFPDKNTSFKLSLKFWWAWAWRNFLITVLSVIILSFLIGLLGALIDMEDNINDLIVNFVALIVTIISPIIVMHHLLKKGFGKYSLLIVERE